MGDELLAKVDHAAPLAECAAFGVLRCVALDALLLDRPGELPARLHGEITAWARAQVAGVRGTARGFDPRAVPEDWLGVLRWAGVPVAVDGDLRWGADLAEGDHDDEPHEVAGRLLMPRPEILAGLSGLGIRPLRAYLGRRLGCRLQAPAGLYVYLWSDQALLVSQLDVPAGGFLHGPGAGQRTTLAVPPGGFQAIRW